MCLYASGERPILHGVRPSITYSSMNKICNREPLDYVRMASTCSLPLTNGTQMLHLLAILDSKSICVLCKYMYVYSTLHGQIKGASRDSKPLSCSIHLQTLPLGCFAPSVSCVCKSEYSTLRGDRTITR